jgi:LmbE family N-acetylglucosaminyl deacetylase
MVSGDNMEMNWLKQAVPLPLLEDSKHILILGPHPDDIEIGAGATIAYCKERNIKMSFLISTDGGAGSSNPLEDVSLLVEQRKSEALRAANYIGVEHFRILDYPDGGNYSIDSLVVDLVQTIVEWGVDMVLCPDPFLSSETHPDHLRLGKALYEAVFLSANPLARRRRNYLLDSVKVACSIGHYFTSRPNSFIPLEEHHLESQREWILFHKSQYPIDSQETKQLFQYITIQKRILGKKINTFYADGLFLMGPIHQHCFPQINDY